MNYLFHTSVSMLTESFKKFILNEQQEIIDPDAKKEIGSHYALSHYMAAFLILGQNLNNKTFLEYSNSIFNHILATNDRYIKYPDYHNDFNNFIWALLIQLDNCNIISIDSTLKQKLTSLLLSTPDSNHDTVNWLCMRAFNNAVRFNTKKSKQYDSVHKQCIQKILKAINNDGYIEDRLPKGYSANLQYHIFSLAILLLSKTLNLSTVDDSILTKATYFTLKAITPEGDCNYIGRGCNQIFAWGPLFFILKFIPNTNQKKKSAESFFYKNFTSKNAFSLLLENASDISADFLWDYHFVSVYQAHLLLWLSLSKLENIGSSKISTENETLNISSIHIFQGRKYYSVINPGTKHYLCEQGPSIAYLSILNKYVLHKGEFGPYFTPFGNRNLSKYNAYANSIGIYVEKHQRKNYILHHIFPKNIIFEETEDSLNIHFTLKSNIKTGQLYFPIPIDDILFPKSSHILVNNKQYDFKKIATIQSLFGWRDLYASQIFTDTKKITLVINYKEYIQNETSIL